MITVNQAIGRCQMRNVNSSIFEAPVAKAIINMVHSDAKTKNSTMKLLSCIFELQLGIAKEENHHQSGGSMSYSHDTSLLKDFIFFLP